ncbi:MAG: hypothetical protein ACTSSA_02165 [Candidatus Freyarchaeota archaeon]
MEKEFMVETEFLFGFQPKDKHYNTVSSILKAYTEKRFLRLYYPTSALMEIRQAMASHQKTAAERLNALTLIKVKAVSFGLQEIGLTSEDLIFCEQLLEQNRDLTFFDGLHAAVALNNKLTIVSNDRIYDRLNVERLSFKAFLDLLRQ